MTAIRILIVDDIRHVREELCNLLKLDANIEVVGEAANGFEAITQTQALQPDVVLLDLEMPILDGFEAARQIKAISPECRVVALSLHSYSAAREKATRSGVDDFIEKGAPLEKLLQSILARKE